MSLLASRTHLLNLSPLSNTKELLTLRLRIRILLLDPPSHGGKPHLNILPITLLQHQFPIPLPKLASNHHMPNIANISMQDHSSDGIRPAQHIWRVAIEADDICLRTDFQDADVVSADCAAALTGGEEEGVFDFHWGFSGDFAGVEGFVVAGVSHALEKEAGLVYDVAAHGPVCVNTKRGVVQDETAGLIAMPVKVFGFWRDGDVPVLLSSGRPVGFWSQTTVGEDDWKPSILKALFGSSDWPAVRYYTRCQS